MLSGWRGRYKARRTQQEGDRSQTPCENLVNIELSSIARRVSCRTKRRAIGQLTLLRTLARELHVAVVRERRADIEADVHPRVRRLLRRRGDDRGSLRRGQWAT